MSEPILLTFKDERTFRVGLGPRDTDLGRSVPGLTAHKYNVQSGEVEWTCPATWYHAHVLKAIFGDRLWGGEGTGDWGRAQQLAELDRLRIKTLPVRPGGDLYDFQKVGVNWMFGSHALLADDMGLGKTVQALQALQAELGNLPNEHAEDALVVTTTSMKYKWAEEARKWAPGWDSVVVIDGTAARRANQIGLAPPGTLFIINWDLLRKHTRIAGYGSIALDTEARREKELNARNIAYVVADECHKAKDPTAIQTRALWWVGRKATRRWALTGTPINNEHADLWSVLHWLEPTWFPSRQEFIDRYTYGYSTDWGFVPVGWQNSTKAELFRFLDLLMLRRNKAEVLPELPPKRYESRTLDLTPKQARAYKAMKKEMMANIDGELLMAPDPLSKLTRLSQIASATPVLEERWDEKLEKNVMEVVELAMPSNKIDALMEIIAEGGGPFIVFAASKKLINLAAHRLDNPPKGGKPIPYVRITGDESAEIRAINVERFQEGQVPVVLCTFGAGSEGITLTAASTAIFLQRPWSFVESRQAEDRFHRIGQEESVLIIDLISDKTVDVSVHDSLVLKGEALESVVRDKDRLREIMETD